MKNKKPVYTQFWFVLIVVLILIAIPFIINCLYMAGLDKTSPNTAFSASDMLLFYGSFLSFIGTVSLGSVAYVQNRKANDISNKLVNIAENANNLTAQANEMNEKMRKLEFDIEKSCLFVFEDLVVNYTGEGEKCRGVRILGQGFNGNMTYWQYESLQNESRANFTISITNISNYPAVNCCITDGKKKIENCNVLHCETIEHKHDKKYILPNKKGQIILNFTLEEISKGIECYLEFGNSYGVRYYQIIKIYKHKKLVILDASVALNIKEEE